MTFGQNLQKLRERAGLSQSDLARRAGLSLRSLQNWEIEHFRIIRCLGSIGVSNRHLKAAT